MAVNVRSTLTNLVKLQVDKASVNRTRNEVRKFAKELQSIYDGIKIPAPMTEPKRGVGSRGGGGHKGDNTAYLIDKALESSHKKEIKREMDLHKLKVANQKKEDQVSNARRKQSVQGITSGTGSGKVKDSIFAQMLKDEDVAIRKAKEFNSVKKDMIRNYMVSNKLIYEMNAEEKTALARQLLKAKSVKELRIEQKRIRQELQRENRIEQQNIRQKQKKLLLQERLNSSVAQMVGALGSIYTMGAVGGATLQVGMDFEAIDKSFLVVSGDAEKAADNMKFAREEAMRLGVSLIETSKGYARMMAAAGNKLDQDQLRGIFTGVNEAAVALGLSQDQVSGTNLAIQQMLSK
ncbi:coil containing protein [Vibrio phage 1.084.O._10N.261.49.F5]|nr:coil containing protein [Vibrio phage 1.084.O._10N.261.49.F5]